MLIVQLLEGWASSVKNTFNQHLYNSSLDVTAPLNFSKDISATFKAGGKFVRTTRVNDFDRNFSGSSDEDTYANVKNFFPDRPRSAFNRLRLTDVMESNFERGKYFLNDEYGFQNGFINVINTDIFDSWLRKSQSGWSPALKQDDSWKDDWNGAESFSAAYIMGTFDIFQDFTLLAGLRYENYNMQYHANVTFTIHNVYGDAISTEGGTIGTSSNPDSLNHNVPYDLYNVNRTDINYFPDVHLKYKVNNWSDIRVAYTTGIARPDYLSVIPKVYIFPGTSFEIGNPKLRPTTSKNLDVVASIYSNEIGLLTVDAYYKELTDVMFTTGVYYGNLSFVSNNVNIPDSAFWQDRFGYTVKSQNVVNTALNNPNLGYIRGIEIGWQTNFWYLPQPLNSLVLDVNYTKSGSNIDYRILRNVPQLVPDPSHPGRFITVYNTIDTVYSGRLVQQAKDVVNVALGVDYKGFSGRLSFNMRGNVLNSVGTRPEETSYTGNIYRWDFTLKQNLPIDGLSLALNGLNIFHNGIKSYRRYRVAPDAPITENLVSVLYSPTVYQLNLRYSF